MQGMSLKTAVETYRDMVFRLAYTYMRSAADADDVCQDVFVKLLRSNQEFENQEHLRNWLVHVTINECKSLFRKPWRRTEDIEQYVHTLVQPESDFSNLLIDVMTLPEKYRVVLVLHYYLELSCEEISKLLNVPAATVRTRLARGRSKLKSVLEGEND